VCSKSCCSSLVQNIPELMKIRAIVHSHLRQVVLEDSPLEPDPLLRLQSCLLLDDSQHICHLLNGHHLLFVKPKIEHIYQKMIKWHYIINILIIDNSPNPQSIDAFNQGLHMRLFECFHIDISLFNYGK